MFAPRVRSDSMEKTYAAIDKAFPGHLERCRAFLRQKSISTTGEGITCIALYATIALMLIFCEQALAMSCRVIL